MRGQWWPQQGGSSIAVQLLLTKSGENPRTGHIYLSGSSSVARTPPLAGRANSGTIELSFLSAKMVKLLSVLRCLRFALPLPSHDALLPQRHLKFQASARKRASLSRDPVVHRPDRTCFSRSCHSAGLSPTNAAVFGVRRRIMDHGGISTQRQPRARPLSLAGFPPPHSP